MGLEALLFLYRDARGEETERRLTQWKEIGYYIAGFCERSDAYRTFRKDRVTEYLDGCAAALSDPHPAPPPTLKKASTSGAPDEKALEILFTGFAKVQRGALEAKAAAAGLHVRKTVTQGLMFLCGGPNAGPTKLEQARAQSVYILDEAQFHWFLETGEVPDGPIEAV